jgi:hypothetical protein
MMVPHLIGSPEVGTQTGDTFAKLASEARSEFAFRGRFLSGP